MAVQRQNEDGGPTVLRSPVWGAVLTQTLARIGALASEGQPQRSTSPALVREGAAAVLARSHARLVAALMRDGDLGDGALSELLDAAAELIGVVPALWLSHADSSFEDRLPALVGALKRQLSAHEHSVLGGEATYSLKVADAERCAGQMRESLSELGARDGGRVSALISLQIAAVNLAALLVRCAGNIATCGRPNGAPEPLTGPFERAVSGVVAEIAAHAQARQGRLTDSRDEVGRYLAGALRVPAPETASGAAEPENLGGFYETWLHLAALERLAIVALDDRLSEPIYRDRFGTLDEAITKTATDVMLRGRLFSRADEFDHDRAWRAQSTALSHALEMYINGISGDTALLQNAQAVALTRLARAAVAVTTVKLQRSAVAAAPGSS